MLAEVAQELNRKLLNEGMEEGKLRDKQDVLERLLDLRFGLEEVEKNLIRNIQEPGLLDSALDAFATGEDKSGILEKLGRN